MNTTTRPVFVIDNAAFMGLPTDEGDARRAPFEGPKSIECKFQSIYVDGNLEDKCSYDIARWACGDIKDKDVQLVTLIGPDGDKYKAALVSVAYTPPKARDISEFGIKRSGYIVGRGEIKRAMASWVRNREEAIKEGYSRMWT